MIMNFCLCGCRRPTKKEYARGHSPNSHILNKETREKISKSLTGKTLSEETKLKMSISHSGVNHHFFGKKRPDLSKQLSGHVVSEQTKEKLRNFRLGKKHTQETKNKISNAGIGRTWKRLTKITTEERIKRREGQLGRKSPEHSIRMTGNGNPAWNGGVSFEPYCEIFSDREFKYFIKNRDGNICLNPCCDRKCKSLNIHHIDYNKKNCELNNLITLCISCNSKANKDREWHELWYKRIIERRYK